MECTTRDDSKTAPFDELDATFRGAGAGAAIDRLIQHLDHAAQYRALLDALLLKARHDLGLPLVPVGSLSELPEPGRSQYEERYVSAIRSVGSKLLEAGDLPSAWSYF